MGAQAQGHLNAAPTFGSGARTIDRIVFGAAPSRYRDRVDALRSACAAMSGLGAPISIVSRCERVEALLTAFQEPLGRDFDAYRGHVYRAITYAMRFLDDDEAFRPLIETAFVYHDIGLWTDRELAYLEPSEALALADNERYGWGLDPTLLRNTIHWHHRITPCRGPNARVVEAARKADWIDASGSRRRMGLPKAEVRAVEEAIPSYDFADVLQRLAGDLGGNRITGTFKVLRAVLKV